MPKLGLIKNFGTEPKNALVNTILVANALIWYVCAFRFMQNAADSISISESSLLLIIALNFIALISAGLFGIALIYKFKNRTTFLKYWIIAGVLISWIFEIANLSNFLSLLIIGVVTGAYFGIGMPACMGYFAAATKPENRAKLAGVIILSIGLFFPLLSSIGNNDLLLNSTVLSIWRLLGLIIFIALKPSERLIDLTEKVSYRSVISNKSFLLYLLPWIMFSLVNDFVMQINTNYFSNTTIFPTNFVHNYLIIENIVAGISAIVCGFLADKKGRKRLALIGFALLGLGYASLGLVPDNYLTAMFFVCASGIAWGSFSMLFIITIWGDIAQEKSGEKYYLIGILPYLLSNFTRFSIGTFISNNVTEGTVFSFASFFLFVAILPLIYAPETLSDKIMKRLDLNNYVNKALEVVKKESEKSNKEPLKKALEENESVPEVFVGSDEYEEARKLAEKYY